jgi:hypothetical protein
MNVYRKRLQRGSPDVIADQLITELESEFDLMRLERYLADLERKDERLVEKIDALKASIEPRASGYAGLRDTGLIRRWGRMLATEGRIFWLRARRKRLAEKWRRCSTLASDIRFGLHVTGMRSPPD